MKMLSDTDGQRVFSVANLPGFQNRKLCSCVTAGQLLYGRGTTPVLHLRKGAEKQGFYLPEYAQLP